MKLDKLLTPAIVMLGLSCWGLAAWGAYRKYAWSEPITLGDIGLLIVLVTAGALLLRAAEDVYRRIKARPLVIPSQPPEVTDPVSVKTVATQLQLKLITTYTDQHGLTADPLIIVNSVIRQDGDLYLIGTVAKKSAAIPVSKIAKIKDVETGAMIHDSIRSWINQRLDGWSGKAKGLDAATIAHAE